ncbi:MAG: hypothetical protein ACP5NY_01055 [Thermocladium sp.]
MIKLIVGSPLLMEPLGLTWRRSPNCVDTGINHVMSNLEKAVLYRLTSSIDRPQHHVAFDVDFRDFINNCDGELCESLRFSIDAGRDAAALGACSSYALMPIEPASTIAGFALASAFKGIAMEIYSDYYLNYPDVMNLLRLSREGELRIFTNTFREDALFLVDEVYVPNVGLPSMREFRGQFNNKMQLINRSEYGLIDAHDNQVSIYEGTIIDVDQDIIKTLTLLVKKLGGASTLASLSDMLSASGVPPTTISRAESMGLMWVERRGTMARAMATPLGFSLVNNQ